MIKIWIVGLSICIILLLAAGCSGPEPDTEWRDYGGNKSGNRYSPLSQINLGNVQTLRAVWTYHSGGSSGKNGGGEQAADQ